MKWLLKRFCEPARRRWLWLVWLYDTSKQGLDWLFIQFANLYLAILFHGWESLHLVSKKDFFFCWFFVLINGNLMWHWQVNCLFPIGFIGRFACHLRLYSLDSQIGGQIYMVVLLFWQIQSFNWRFNSFWFILTTFIPSYSFLLFFIDSYSFLFILKMICIHSKIIFIQFHSILFSFIQFYSFLFIFIHFHSLLLVYSLLITFFLFYSFLFLLILSFSFLFILIHSYSYLFLFILIHSYSFLKWFVFIL